MTPAEYVRMLDMRGDMQSAYRLRWQRAIDRKWSEASEPGSPSFTYLLNDLEVEFWKRMTHG